MLIAACAAGGERPSGATVTRLDDSTIDTTALTQQIEALTRAANVHGLTVTIFNDAEKVYSHAVGFADQPAGKPLRTDTEMYGASLSKAVFSVLVMKLVEQGVLDLDKPVQEYAKDPLWQNRASSERAWHEDLSDLRADPRYQRITARMSMSHTTGLPGWRWFEPDQKLHIHFEPGEKFSYSGEGMTLLQIVIEKITGKPLEQLMQEQVFTPLGMTMSSYMWQPRFEADYAVGHKSDGTVHPKDKDNAPRAPSTLETTTDDYARFMAAVLRRDGLSETSWNEIFKPQVRIRSRMQFAPGASETTSVNDAIALSYGLGWGLQKTPYGWGAFKEGHGDGFQHYSIVYPGKKLGVLLMSNSDNAESIFSHLLTLTIADTFTPLEWENYVPYDRARSGTRSANRQKLARVTGKPRRETAVQWRRLLPGGRFLGMRSLLLLLGLACAPVLTLSAQPARGLDLSLQRLVNDYTGLYVRDSLPRWRELFLPAFTAASTTADTGVTVRGLDEFYAAQVRGFGTAKKMGERLENVRMERRGRLATVWADFVYWHDDDTRRGRLVLAAILQSAGWRFHSLMFSYHG